MNNYIKGWKEKLPDYKFILWNLNNFDIKSTIWTQQAFQEKKYAFAADYIRLYAIYNHGGIYMDMDVEVLKPFSDELLSKDYMLCYEGKNKGIEAGIMGGEKGAKWLEDCICHYDNRAFILPNGKFDTTPLPEVLFNSLNNKYLKTGIIVPKTYDYFTAKCFENGKIKITENTYTIHHFKGSWLSKGHKFKIMIIRILGPQIMNIIRKWQKRFQ